MDNVVGFDVGESYAYCEGNGKKTAPGPELRKWKGRASQMITLNSGPGEIRPARLSWNVYGLFVACLFASGEACEGSLPLLRWGQFNTLKVSKRSVGMSRVG